MSFSSYRRHRHEGEAHPPATSSNSRFNQAQVQLSIPSTSLFVTETASSYQYTRPSECRLPKTHCTPPKGIHKGQLDHTSSPISDVIHGPEGILRRIRPLETSSRLNHARVSLSHRGIHIDILDLRSRQVFRDLGGSRRIDPQRQDTGYPQLDQR